MQANDSNWCTRISFVCAGTSAELETPAGADQEEGGLLSENPINLNCIWLGSDRVVFERASALFASADLPPGTCRLPDWLAN